MIKHRYKLLISAVGLVLLLAGCGVTDLRVTVSVLDPDYLAKHRTAAPIESVEAGARIAQKAITDGPFSTASIEKTAEAVRAAMAKALASEALAPVRPFISDQLDYPAIAADMTKKALEEARGSLERGVKLVVDAQRVRADQIGLALEYYRDAAARIEEADRLTANVVGELENQLDQDLEVIIGSVGDPQKKLEIRSALQGPRRVVVLDTSDLIRKAFDPQLTLTTNASGGLLGDPLLGYVVRAPEEQWKGILNIASAKACGTDSDVAIVMDDIAKFSVKGIRANSTAATAATFTTLGRVMNIAAVVAGVPVPGLLPQGKAPTTGETVPASALVTSKTQLEQQDKEARRRLVRLLDAVLQEGKTSLEAPDGGLRTRIATRLEAEKKK